MVKSHPSVDWLTYFKSIRTECPWSLKAYQQGEIEIVGWTDTGVVEPLGQFQARIYTIDLPYDILEALATELDCDDLESEWLFSHPGLGDYATPVAVLIQQDRARLTQLRKQLGCPHE